MQHFSRLRVSALARTLIKSTYEFTRTLPRDEQFGLSRQMRRAAVSVGLNIAEGCSRSTTREFLRYLEISRGSAMELEFAKYISIDLEMGDSDRRELMAEDLDHAQAALSALINSLRRRSAAGTRR